MPALKRFFKYAVVGGATFALDLLLLFVCTDMLSFNYIVAAGVAYGIAVSLNYYLSRRFVFVGSMRRGDQGYVLFLLIALSGLLFVMAGMYVLVEAIGVHYLVARVGIAGIVGFWNYLMNLFVNFKVAGKHGGIVYTAEKEKQV